MFSQASVILSTGRGMCGRGQAWQGDGGVHGGGACMVGGVHGGGHAWHRGMCDRGRAWQRGACIAGDMHGRGACMVGEGACMVVGHAWQGGMCGTHAPSPPADTARCGQ